MTDPAFPPPVPPQHPASGAMAITSFVLGIIALLAGLFVIGGLIGLVGLILGIVHLKRGRTHRVLAGWGIGLSSIGMALTVAVVLLFWIFVRPLLSTFTSMAGGESFESSEWIGKPMPEMTLTTLDGRTLHSADWKGHPVVLNMWASWHPACAGAVPDFTRLVAETSAEGVQVLAVTFENASDLGEFTTNRAINFPIVATTNLPAPFGNVDMIPTTFFINADGIIRDIRVGYEGYDALKNSALDRAPPAVEKNKED